MNANQQLFAEWARSRAAMIQPPWYKSFANWTLITTFLLFMAMAAALLFSLGGDPRVIPFP